MSIDDQSNNDRFGADLLRGAVRIAAYLKELGEINVEPDNVYYLKKSGKYPIGRHKGELIASKRQLARHARKISSIAESRTADSRTVTGAGTGNIG